MDSYSENIRTLTTVNQAKMALPAIFLHLLNYFNYPIVVTCHMNFAHGGGSDM